MSSTRDARTIERFHHLAIRLLRNLRAVDEAHGFSGPRASALSVLVFRGPQSLAALAAAEGVKPPTMSRLVKAMQAEGLVSARPAEGDQRGIRIEATPRGRKRMLEGRERRLSAIRGMLEGASPAEMRALETVANLLERALP
jgi:DNA-binding MarR family transcriptional regulator